MTDGEKIVQAVRTWLGTPHVNNAKVKGAGVDCGMLLIAATEDAGLVTKDSIPIVPYSNEWHLHRSEEWFLAYVKQYCERVDTPEPGDFLLFQFGRCISHGAVYVGDNKVIHAVINQGVILSDLSEVMFVDAKGHSRLKYIYRYKSREV